MKFLGGVLTGLVLAAIVVVALVAALDLVITEKNVTVTVPDVTDARPTDARSQLAAADLTGRVVKPPDPGGYFSSLFFPSPPPVVREQSPAPGREVNQGTYVTLHVR